MQSECGLCHQNAVLVESHLIPAAIYRLCKNPAEPNPVMFSGKSAVATTQEVKKPFLCHSCEQQFHEKGENWTLANLRRSESEFGLYEKLPTTPDESSGDGSFYRSAGTSIDVNAIEYFAASIFWRAAATTWLLPGGPRKLPLGPYEDRLRLYLLGSAAFPQNISLQVTVCRPQKAVIAFAFPSKGRNAGGMNMMEFSLPGIHFQAILARHFDGQAQSWIFNSPERWIRHSDEHFVELGREMGEQALRSPRKGILQKRFGPN